MNVELPSLVSGDTTTPLREKTIGKLLADAVHDYSDNIALTCVKQNVHWTYAELQQQVDEFAKGLLNLGLDKGDCIGIWSPNNAEWIVTMYAAAKLGLVLVNVNPAYRPSELEYALNKVECKALVLANRFKTSDYVGIIRSLAPEVDTCQPGDLQAAKLPHLRVLILIEGDENGFYRFADRQAIGRTSSVDLTSINAACDPHDAVNIQFTSGTTGSPKGATLTHNNVVNNAYFVGRGIDLSSADKICSPVPLYHCFGMVMATLACANYGATLVLPNESFDPLSTLEALQSENCTVLYGVPTMFNLILNHERLSDYDVSSLRTGIVAGSLCPKSLMARIIDELNMAGVTNCYGMTETSPVSFQSAVDDDIQKRFTTVGRVHPHVRVKVINRDGAIVPRGQPGELCTRGYSVMQGYWADVKRTEESIIDGWMHTGDEAIIDEQGYCAIVGRIKDTIIRGGENIAPKEVEECLLSHPNIQEAQVFGVSDDKFGEIVAAWLMLDEGAALTETQVKDYCFDQIAHFKVPAIIRFVDEYPMTVTGKMQKFVMRQEMEKELA